MVNEAACGLCASNGGTLRSVAWMNKKLFGMLKLRRVPSHMRFVEADLQNAGCVEGDLGLGAGADLILDCQALE